VGWYHSHPSFGIFLSEHDLFIHRNFFSGPAQIAVVVDPINCTEGVFAWRHGEIAKVLERSTPSAWRARPVRRPPPPVSSLADGYHSDSVVVPGFEARARLTALIVAVLAGLLFGLLVWHVALRPGPTVVYRSPTVIRRGTSTTSAATLSGTSAGQYYRV
jgi:hypothetical protein